MRRRLWSPRPLPHSARESRRPSEPSADRSRPWSVYFPPSFNANNGGQKSAAGGLPARVGTQGPLAASVYFDTSRRTRRARHDGASRREGEIAGGSARGQAGEPASPSETEADALRGELRRLLLQAIDERRTADPGVLRVRPATDGDRGRFGVSGSVLNRRPGRSGPARARPRPFRSNLSTTASICASGAHAITPEVSATAATMSGSPRRTSTPSRSLPAAARSPSR